MSEPELKVLSIRYFDTRRGTGYQAKTNVDGVEIWNDGMGGCTFLEGDNAHKYKHLDWDGEDKMDELIDQFEKYQANKKYGWKKFRVFLKTENSDETSTIILHEKSKEILLSRFDDLPIDKVEEVTDE